MSDLAVNFTKQEQLAIHQMGDGYVGKELGPTARIVVKHHGSNLIILPNKGTSRKFHWGYREAGPNALAYSIICDVFDKKVADSNHNLVRKFKDEFISEFGDFWSISTAHIIQWWIRQMGHKVVLSQERFNDIKLIKFVEKFRKKHNLPADSIVASYTTNDELNIKISRRVTPFVLQEFHKASAVFYSELPDTSVTQNINNF